MLLDADHVIEILHGLARSALAEIVQTRNNDQAAAGFVQREAEVRKIKLLILPTSEAIEELTRKPDGTNAILHVTC